MANTYTVTLTDAENKALRHVAITPQFWIDNIVHERCRVAMEEIINAEVKKKLDAGEPITQTKDELVLEADIMSAEDRNNLPVV